MKIANQNFLLIILSILINLSAYAVETLVYFNDFNNGADLKWSDRRTTTANGEAFLGEFDLGPKTLTLNNLPAHTNVKISFDLYIIGTWDGNNLLFTTFSNYVTNDGLGVSKQVYPSQLSPYGSGGQFPARAGAFETGHLGYGIGNYGDTTYRLSFTIAHKDANLILNFNSMQTEALSDEGWGLDNVSITIISQDGNNPENRHLVNISTRSFVGTGNQNQIAGFIINSNTKIAVRALGQGLVAQGVPTALNARLQVYTYPSRNLVAENDDWQSGASVNQLKSLGLDPSHPTDAALILDLPAGAYTVEVSPVAQSGVGLIEILELLQ